MIEADSYAARAVAARKLDPCWWDIYDNDDFMKDAELVYPKGEIGRITTDAHAS